MELFSNLKQSVGSLLSRTAHKPNFVVGIDPIGACVKVMRMQGIDVASATVDYLGFDRALLDRAAYGDIIGAVLPAYMQDKPFEQTADSYLVVPDRLVGIDLLTVPTLSRARMGQALATQVADLYKDARDFRIAWAPVKSTRLSTVFAAVSYRKELMAALYKEMALNKLHVKNSTFAASAAVNALFALRPKTRKRSFLFVDIKENCATFVVVSNGAAVSFSSLPFGYGILAADKVLSEDALYDHTAAELAVVNAAERARQKKLTERIEEDAGFSFTVDLAATADEPILDEAKAQVRRSSRRLPQFMQRPLPDTKEGVAEENFRIFLKKILLTVQYVADSAIFAAPEFVMINLPGDFAYLVDRLGADGENDIPFRWFDPTVEHNAHVTENLELYGALFMGQYNRTNNF